MKTKMFTILLACSLTAVLSLPACAGDGDDGLLLLPFGFGQGGPEESPQAVPDGNTDIEVDEVIAVTNSEDPSIPAAESVTDTETAELALASGSSDSSGATETEDSTASGDESATDGSNTTGPDDSGAGEGVSSGVIADGSETSGDTVSVTDDSSGNNAGDTGTGTSGDSSANNGNGDNANGNGNSGKATGNGNTADSSGACDKRTSDLDPALGKWYQDDKKGIYTYWARQTLLLKVRGNCEAGWYKLQVKATNTHGPLPDFYDSFNVSVQDNASGRELGSMLIKAKDNGYDMGQMYVYLPVGDSDLNLLWTNDAYKKDEYDANILIADVMLHKNATQRARKNDERSAVNYCLNNGRWFFDSEAGTARTYWANQTIGYCFYDLEPGTYEIAIEARNYGALGAPANYKNFKVNVAGDGVATEAVIAVNNGKDFKTGTAVLDFRGGDVTVSLTWLNDSYKEGVYDANIEIRGIQVKRTGDSSRTGLSAFLSSAGQGSGLVISVAVVVALLGLGLLYAYRRRMGGAEIA